MLRKNRRQTFLLPTNTCPRILLAASCEWFLLAASCHLHTSCHCAPCIQHGAAISLPHASCHSRTNLPANLVIANSEKIFPRSLNVSLPRATLVAWWKQSVCKQHLFLDYFATLVMTKNQDGHEAQGLSP